MTMLSFSKNSKLILRRETVATLSSTSLDAVLGGAAGAAEAPGALQLPKPAEAQVFQGRLGDLIAPRRLGSCFCPPRP
jgi:hypothetical protein